MSLASDEISETKTGKFPGCIYVFYTHKLFCFAPTCRKFLCLSRFFVSMFVWLFFFGSVMNKDNYDFTFGL